MMDEQTSSDEYEVVEYVYEVEDDGEYVDEIVYEEVYVDAEDDGFSGSSPATHSTWSHASSAAAPSLPSNYTATSVPRDSSSSATQRFLSDHSGRGSLSLAEAFKNVARYNPSPAKRPYGGDVYGDSFGGGGGAIGGLHSDDVDDDDDDDAWGEELDTNVKRIFIPAIGSLGDVLPFVAMGLALCKKGHSVVIGSSPTYRSLIVGHGLSWVEIEGDLEYELAHTPLGAEVRKSKRVNTTQDFMFPLMAKWFKSIARHASECDMLILTITSLLAGFSAWEKYPDTLAMVMYSYPATPTKFYAPTSARSSTSIFNFINSIKWVFMDFSHYKFWKDHVNKLRHDVYNIGPVSGQFRNHLRRVRERPIPFVTMYSAYLYPRPMDWPINQHLTGAITYHTSEQLEDFEPPHPLKEFLDNSEDEGVPVYIGFGNMLGTMLTPEEQKQQIDMWVHALERARTRGIVSIHGYPHPEQYDNSRGELDRLHNTFFIDAFIPHAWLFQRCSAVIHHGGAGTTHTVLRFGLPSLTVPFGGDQRFNGDRLFKTGVGLAPIPIAQLTQERLVHSIVQLTSDADLRKRAQSFGRKIRLENGLTRTVELVDRVIDRGNTSFASGLKEKYGTDKWMPDSEASTCCHCKCSFSTFRRKHHCRRCGLIFCKQCCHEFLQSGESSRGRVRMCVVCARATREDAFNKAKERELDGVKLEDDALED